MTATRGRDTRADTRRQDFSSSAHDINSSQTLPPYVYTDASFYELESQEIFLKDWLCVGRVEHVPNPGDFVSLEIAGEPLVMVRDRTRDIRVMSSVCRHRGMVVTDPVNGEHGDWERQPRRWNGCTQAFKCPYHWWTYGLDGKLISAPDMERAVDFDRADVALPNLAVEIWNGFVFANFDREAESLAPTIEQTTRELANWHLDEMEGETELRVMRDLPFNWKVMLEGSIESYHVSRLHYPLHEASPADGLLDTPFDCDTENAILTRSKAIENYSVNPTSKPIFPTIKTLTEDDCRTSRSALLPPTLMIGTNSDSAWYRLTYPSAVDKVDTFFSYLIPTEYKEIVGYRELLDVAGRMHLRINNQDHMAGAGIQRGLRSAVAERGRYSWQEQPLAAFNSWLVRRYNRMGL